ncbi:alpha/beta hydrolase [Pontibacter sp. HSC-14F20]|uniref:alpha/beta hydrolase n=1 Tax=Pontibacter sp. HSC-14F20 TaxID=2864136 RepID=UPI001C737330|nr:alpha/beta hydrolase [Pontibacter sp. HSC-14F20]MBX0335319.1 alpha/beta hydrolase [Pontibacter sp. HSC-14F20]
MKLVLPFLLSVILLSGCGRPVLYGVSASNDSGRAIDNKMKIYIDREGSLYPEASTQSPVDNERLLYHKGFLRTYYQYHTKKKWETIQQEEYKSIQKKYDVSPNPSSTLASENYKNWIALQSKIRSSYINKLNHQIETNKPEALIILVHGYNNDVDKAKWYEQLEQYLLNNQFKGKAVQFLEVRWDGGTSTSALGIWGYAQHSMYPVGLTLRNIISNINNKDLPIRIIAHSTGAPLSCIALWNSESALSGNDLTIWGNSYKDLSVEHEYTTPIHKSIRVAFIAPAMPSSHFNEFTKRTGNILQSNNYDRIIFGHNRKDAATGKSILPSSIAGATTLGVNSEEYCKEVFPRLDSVGTYSKLVDFTGPLEKAGYKRAHGVKEFMATGNVFDTFIDLLILEKAPTSHIHIKNCLN